KDEIYWPIVSSTLPLTYWGISATVPGRPVSSGHIHWGLLCCPVFCVVSVSFLVSQAKHYVSSVYTVICVQTIYYPRLKNYGTTPISIMEPFHKHMPAFPIAWAATTTTKNTNQYWQKG
ncbi:MAG: hypothetical protein LBT36_06015, partial [Oscillospiraceae bacterium]|nr:hypothetical protein [Oscillospiraceae bacterium]